jgi:hypothetical protein
MSVAVLQELPISEIAFTAQNPRSDFGDVSGLAASMGEQDSPLIAQYPTVARMDMDRYVLIAGARRIRAAKEKGWDKIMCLVRSDVDPLTAHQLRLVENLHREALHPLDEAMALKVSWAIANAEAMGLLDQVQQILSQDQPLHIIIGELTSLLDENDFCITKPRVTWDDVLNQLGVSLEKESRKKLMRVLLVDPSVFPYVRKLNLSEAALRSLGSLDPENQKYLIDKIVNTTDEKDRRQLIGKIRRISNVVRTKGYSIEEAIAEAFGKVVGFDNDTDTEQDNAPENENATDGENPGNETTETEDLPEDRITKAVTGLLDIAGLFSVTIQKLETALDGGNLSSLPSPWGDFALEAFDLIENTLEKTRKLEV